MGLPPWCDVRYEYGLGVTAEAVLQKACEFGLPVGNGESLLAGECVYDLA